MDNKDFLEKILPHNKKMILIDDVIDYSIKEKWLTSEVTINEDSHFFDKRINGVSSIVGIEYMAQTIGCYAYYRNGKKEPKIGYLLGSKKYNNNIDKFELGKRYTIKVEEIFLDELLVSFSCFIYNSDKEVIADAIVTVYQDNRFCKE